jgi:hypothetical protein
VGSDKEAGQMRIDLIDMRSLEAIEDRNEKVFKAALYYASQGIPVNPQPYGEKANRDKSV